MTFKVIVNFCLKIQFASLIPDQNYLIGNGAKYTNSFAIDLLPQACSNYDPDLLMEVSDPAALSAITLQKSSSNFMIEISDPRLAGTYKVSLLAKVKTITEAQLSFTVKLNYCKLSFDQAPVKMLAYVD